VFVGAGPDSYAAELGIGDDLIFTGGVSLAETVAFYRAAGLLAHPSHNETFGLPILEAVACGCPVVTSQVSSMPEIAGGAAIPPIPPPSPRPWWPG
jgi:glycosyltransferase involved in cell wall biosynthesis